MDHKLHVFGSAVELRRNGMCTEEGRTYVHGAQPSRVLDRPQRLQLGLAVESVARLGLRGRRPVLQHPPEVTLHGRPELLLASGPCRGHRRADAAAGSVDLLIDSPRGAQLELGRTVPQEGRVRMAVDETRARRLATPVNALKRDA